MKKNQKILMVVAIITILFSSFILVSYIRYQKEKDFLKVKHYIDMGDIDTANAIVKYWPKDKFKKFEAWRYDRESGNYRIRERKRNAILTLGISTLYTKKGWKKEFKVILDRNIIDDQFKEYTKYWDKEKLAAFEEYRAENASLIDNRQNNSSTEREAGQEVANNSVDNNSVSTPQIGDIISVTSEKAYFYKEANESTIRKAYLVYGDEVEIVLIQDDFVYCEYTNSDSGKVTKGWIKFSDLGL